MRKRTGRRVVIAVALLAIATLVGAFFALKDTILEQVYIWMLESSDREVCRRAIVGLGKMRSLRAIPSLIQRLPAWKHGKLFVN